MQPNDAPSSLRDSRASASDPATAWSAAEISHPVLSPAEARDLEAALFGADEQAEWNAMQRAGQAVAAAVQRDWKEISSHAPSGGILVLAGKGHNGGDALIAADHLRRVFPDGRIDVLFPLGTRSLRPLTARAQRELVGRTGGVNLLRRADDVAQRYDVLIDGVFGFQFRPPLGPAEVRLFDRLERLDVRLRAAVDLPSGLGDDAALRADFTYATGSVKDLLLDPRHRAKVGRVRYLDLGFFRNDTGTAPPPGAVHVLLPSALDPLRALRPAESDKRSYGHVFLLGGSRAYPGAILMAAQAAVRSGVGLVTVFVPESLAPAFAAALPEAMWVGWPETPEGTLALEGLNLWRERCSRATAVVLGPGLDRNRETLALCTEVAKSCAVPLLLDADALQGEVVRAAAPQRCVLTPHAGEFARIAGASDARQYVQQTGLTLVLKGAVTQVVVRQAGAKPDGCVALFSPFGGPVLARGGSGDLLAGLMGGLMAAPGARIEAAACRAVVWQGLAADLLAQRFGQTALKTTQLLDFLPEALRS